MPDAYADISFQESPHSKFLLLNGWQMKIQGENYRQAYKNGLWFFKNNKNKEFLNIELWIPESNLYSNANIKIIINSVDVKTIDVKRGKMVKISIPVSQNGKLDRFVAEVQLSDNLVEFSDMCFRVYQFELGNREF